jgi:hypothetical protein
MKRGRPSKRSAIQGTVLEVLGSSSTPLTISALVKISSEKLQQSISWNTVEKYVRELVETERIQPICLPHSKELNKPGLTVYSIKK